MLLYHSFPLNDGETTHTIVGCDEEFCPVCQIRGQTTFQLKGLCNDSYIDRLYVMKENTELVGYSRTKMVWTASDSRWQIVDIIRNNLLAYSENSVGIPIGTNMWKIIEGNASHSQNSSS